jgi:crotonobetainyl-CoA:carnitine CoA-transferase CaiB-like acyl-CoA transferase
LKLNAQKIRYHRSFLKTSQRSYRKAALGRNKMPKPLEGIKVLDFSIAVAAPLGGAMLADMGAEVIKIERIQGEAQRHGLPAGMDEAREPEEGKVIPDKGSWIALNRGKKNIAVDIRDQRGKEIVLKLAKGTDVLIESFRPGVMDRLGLGYEIVSGSNPGVIYCSFSGYGDTGPMTHRAGGDMWSQAMSGMISVMGYPGGPPQMANFGPVDHAGGMLTAYGVMTALFVRERTGRGQRITLNNLNAAMYLQFVQFGTYLIDGVMPYKGGRSTFGMAPPFGPYRAKDGDVLTIFGGGPLWPKFCGLMGLEHLAHDPRFESDENRTRHQEEVDRLLDEAFSRKTRGEWQKIFKKAKMRCDPCLTYEEICAHPQVAENEILYATDHPLRGKIRMLDVPVKLSETPGRPQGPSPLLGEHSEMILLELGYTPKEITELEQGGVVKTCPPISGC